MVKKILQRSKDPVIIIQADHGTGSSYFYSPEYKRERYSILNAFYGSHQFKQQLYPDISPVNTFRVLCNTYFETNLPLLEDKSFLSKITSPFDVQEITR